MLLVPVLRHVGGGRLPVLPRPRHRLLHSQQQRAKHVLVVVPVGVGGRDTMERTLSMLWVFMIYSKFDA